MNRDETNEVSGVTDDQLGRTAEPKSGTDTSRTQQTRIIRVHRLGDVFRNRTTEYHTTEEL